ncbi:MAG: MarR family transcriptional regulator [Chitinophagales bacterium]
MEEALYLQQQLCFPLYAAARLTMQVYEPHLKAIGLTYPQYLVMLVLWEHHELSVTEIAERLLLDTNTITPLLKRLEEKAMVQRRRNLHDERKVLVSLTSKGKRLKMKAKLIPEALRRHLLKAGLHLSDLRELKQLTDQFVTRMQLSAAP